MNKVILIGRIANTLELKEMPTGKKVCNFSVAVSKDIPKKILKEHPDMRSVNFLDITVYGEKAQALCLYNQKGDKIAVSGSLERTKNKKDDGTNFISTFVLADNIEFLEYNKNEE